MNKFTAASFFTGIGGLDLAAERAGFRVDYMCEINSYCRALLAQHFPQTIIYEDIRHVCKKDIGAVDLIFGGFPCQDISQAGTKQGLRGSRSGLWFELARIISTVGPRIIVLENVSAITFRGGTTVTAHLAHMGYSTIWFTVPASIFGSPQHRTRWFLLGYTDRLGHQRSVIGEVHQTFIGAYRSGQRISKFDETIPTCESGRTRSRTAYQRTGNQPRMGRNAHGLSARVDILKHTFPAGSWQPQHMNEPPRLKTPGPYQKERIQALGNAVVPQQAYPVFAAAYEFLDTIEKGVSCHG